MMIKQTAVVIAILAGLFGCQQKQEDQAAHDAKVAQQAREELLKELKAKEEAKRQAAQEKEAKFSKVGIQTTQDGKIIIDTNRTKHYFKTIAEKWKQKADKLASDLQKGMIDEKEAGIEVSDKRIVVDLNKTESFLMRWTKKMENFVKEVDKTAQVLQFDINNSIKIK